MPTLALRIALLSLSACEGLQGLPHGGPWLDEPEPCEKRTSGCWLTEDCVSISGRHLDDAGACMEQDYLGCRSAHCKEASTFASDPDGGLWQFPTRCVPLGFTVAQLDAGQSDAWLRCSDP